MISNQILQSTLDGLKSITKADFGIYDPDGKQLVTTLSDMEADRESLTDFAQSQADTQSIGDLQFFKVYDEHQLAYILLSRKKGNASTMIGSMAAFQIQSLLVAYKERFDKDNFIKNLLMDNLLLVDIYNRARKLRIAPEADRVVFILETPPDQDQATVENLRNQLATHSGDFITAIDEKSIIIVRELEPGEGYSQPEEFAASVLKLVCLDEDENTHIAYGTIVHELKEVSRSYKEARMALDVGKIFFDGRNSIAYSSLGIGRLIYQLPIPLCKMFIKEIFSQKAPDDFDEETLVTINKFFENNLNVSETSRQLYIHRNTLVYRLDKLQKSTGLDLRVFEDAITFKIALMVVKYMKYMETLEY